MPYEGVVEGIYMVGGAGLSGPGDCCVYLVDAGDGGSVLVDAGLSTSPEALFHNIEETGHRVEDIVAEEVIIDGRQVRSLNRMLTDMGLPTG